MIIERWTLCFDRTPIAGDVVFKCKADTSFFAHLRWDDDRTDEKILKSNGRRTPLLRASLQFFSLPVYSHAGSGLLTDRDIALGVVRGKYECSWCLAHVRGIVSSRRRGAGERCPGGTQSRRREAVAFENPIRV